MQNGCFDRGKMLPEVDEMYTYYRMKGSKSLMALYRCEHCGQVALHPVQLKKETTYDPGWTRKGTEKRRARKEEALSGRMDKAAEKIAGESSATAFLGKQLEGKCPHCEKKQSWMRMGYGLWARLLGIMALMSPFGWFNVATFEGRRAQLQTVQSVTTLVTAATILLALALVIHAVIMMMNIRRACQDSPVLIARSVEELNALATQHPAYLTELKKSA